MHMVATRNRWVMLVVTVCRRNSAIIHQLNSTTYIEANTESEHMEVDVTKLIDQAEKTHMHCRSRSRAWPLTRTHEHV